MTKKRSNQDGQAADGKKKSRSSGEAVTDAFLAWCGAMGIKHPKCTIGTLPGTGRGVIATGDISEGEVVVEVPDSAVLMVETCRIADRLEEAGLSKAEASDALLEVQGLVLAVAAEKAAGKHSRWHPYLSFIPEDLSHLPMYWSDDELTELRGTAALDKMEGRVQTPADAPTQVRMLWEEIAEPFISENPSCKMPTGDKGWSLYQWATAVVSSYSFILGDDHYQAMVPFWDALNHITGAVNVRLNHVEGRRGREGRLQMIATRSIGKGEEVVNNYGELSQAELLRAYGYVEHHDQANKYAHVQVPLRFVLQACYAVVLRHRSDDANRSDRGAATEGAKSNALDGEAVASDGEADSDGGSDWGLDTDSDTEHTTGDASTSTQPLQARGPPGSDAKPHGEGSVASAAEACGHVQLRAVQQRVRGLPGRLRFLKRVGLLAKNNVFKVYAASEGSRPGTPAMAEAVRVLLMVYEDFTALRRAARAQRTVASAVDRSTATAPTTLTDIIISTATDVHCVLRCVAQYMLGRYSCGLQSDEDELQQCAGEAGSVAAWAARPQTDRSQARRHAALVARVPEKQCLCALDAVWRSEGPLEGLRMAVHDWWAQPRWKASSESESGSDSDDETDSSAFGDEDCANGGHTHKGRHASGAGRAQVQRRGGLRGRGRRAAKSEPVEGVADPGHVAGQDIVADECVTDAAHEAKAAFRFDFSV